MPVFDRDGISLYYETRGSGPPLLLIAGMASDSQSWQPVVNALAEGFTTIVFDNRGCGRSRPMDEFVSIAGMAADGIRLLDHLGIGAAHVVGHSMGGFIAQELALRRPDRVVSLVLAATACRTSARNSQLFAGWAQERSRGADPGEWFRRIFYWLFSARFFEDPAAVTRALDAAVGYPYPQSGAAFANQVWAMAGFDRSGDLSGITLPTLVLAGREDILFPPESTETLFSLLPAGRLATIGNAAHSIHVEQPEAFYREVVAYLERERRYLAPG